MRKGRKQTDSQLQTRLAVALKHVIGSGEAPRVVASGSGHMATRIMELAKEHHVPVQEDPALAHALSAVGVDKPIPEELFGAVARVLAFVYRVDHRIPTESSSKGSRRM